MGAEWANKEMGEDHANEVVMKRGNGVGESGFQEAKHTSVGTNDFGEETHQSWKGEVDEDRFWNDCKARNEHESFVDFGADKEEFGHNVEEQVGMFEQKHDEKCLNKDRHDIETSQVKSRKLPALENHNGDLETLEETPDKIERLERLHTYNNYLKISDEKPNNRKRLEDSDDHPAISEGSCSENRGPLDLGEDSCTEKQRGQHCGTEEYLGGHFGTGEYFGGHFTTEERSGKLCGTKDHLREHSGTDEQRGNHGCIEEYLGGHFGTGEYFGGQFGTEGRPGELCGTEEKIGGLRDTKKDLGELCDTKVHVGEHRVIEEHLGELSGELKEKHRGTEEHVEEQYGSRQRIEEKCDKELSEIDFSSENLSEKIYDDEESRQQLFDRGVSSEKLRKADSFNDELDDSRLPLRKLSDQNPFANHVCNIQNFGEHLNAKNVEKECLGKTLVSKTFGKELDQTKSESGGCISGERFDSLVRENPVIFRHHQTGDSFMKMETVALLGDVGESESSSCDETGSERSGDETPRDLSQVPISSQDFDNVLEAYLETSTSRKSEKVVEHSEEVSEKVVEHSEEISESNVAEETRPKVVKHSEEISESNVPKESQPKVVQDSEEMSESDVPKESQPLVEASSQSRKAGKSATLVSSVNPTDRNKDDVINQQPQLVGSTADAAQGNGLREFQETDGDRENSMFYGACADDVTVYLSALPANWKQAWYQAYERQTKFISTYTELYRGAFH